jgi:hypothetical protein
MTGQKPLGDELVPLRVFTRDNVGALKLDSATEKSGDWYGDPTYKTEYAKLWGVGG